MTDLADTIVTALFDMSEQHGGLIKDRAIERVREIIGKAALEEERLYAMYSNRPNVIRGDWNTLAAVSRKTQRVSQRVD